MIPQNTIENTQWINSAIKISLKCLFRSYLRFQFHFSVIAVLKIKKRKAAAIQLKKMEMILIPKKTRK